MNDDRLIEALRRADAAAPRPPAPRAVAAAARERARQRRTVRRTTASGTVLAAGAITCLLLLSPWSRHPVAPLPPQPATLATTTVAALEAERERLRAEVAQRRQTVELLLRAERLARTRVRPVGIDPLQRLERESDATAAALMAYADRLDRGLGLQAQAIEEYRVVLARFPRTHWAEVARRRLREIDTGSS